MNEQQFWEHVKVGYPNECWEWQKRLSSMGYGQLYWCGETIGAHRLAYCLEHSLGIRSLHGEYVLHNCDHRNCCNPGHLRLGTQSDNIRDMDNRGRRGDSHTNSKLTEEQALEIRTNVRLETQRELGIRFGISKSTVGQIIRRETWNKN